MKLNFNWSGQFVFSRHRVNYHLLLAVPHYPDFLPFADSSVCASLTALDVFCCLCENPSVCYSLLAVGPNVPSAPVRRISSQHLEIQMFIFLSINDPQQETEWEQFQKISPTVDIPPHAKCPVYCRDKFVVAFLGVRKQLCCQANFFTNDWTFLGILFWPVHKQNLKWQNKTLDIWH